MSKNPEQYSSVDFVNYGNLLLQTNAIHRNNDPNNPNPKSSKSYKWKNFIKPIWEHYKPKTSEKRRRKHQEDPIEGTGIIIPSDPNALLERLDLLLASQEAGHTGVVNELVSICDELKRQKVINADEYKKINSIIKK